MTQERFVSPCKPPEGQERELLEVLAEECAEVIQRVTKALRFGIEEVQPGQPDSNSRRIGLELGDVMETVDKLRSARVLEGRDIQDGMIRKSAQLAKFLQAQP